VCYAWRRCFPVWQFRQKRNATLIDSDLYIIRKRRQRHTLIPTCLSLSNTRPNLWYRLVSPFVRASARALVSLRLIDALPYIVRIYTHTHRLDRRNHRRALLLLYYYCVCHTDVSFRRNDFDMSTDDVGDTFTAHTRYASLPISTALHIVREERAFRRSIKTRLHSRQCV